MPKQHFISVVIPVFNEEGNIAPLARAVEEVLPALWRRELIFVDDGSADKSLPILRSLSAADPSIRYISFSRNFGHQAALRAGLEAARGDCVLSMDGDFQHPPALIPTLIAEFEKGFDIVQTKRLDDAGPARAGGGAAGGGAAGGGAAGGGAAGASRPSFAKKATSRLFYAITNALSDTKIEPGSADFRILSRRACDVILSMKEHNLFMRGAVPWTGLPTSEIDYVPEKRRSGESKYTISKMFALAMDGITSFSTKPLRLTSFAGIVISGIGFVYALYALFARLFTDRTVAGWTSILISVLIIGGIQLISLGIIGEYLGKLFMEAKARPHYIVKETSPDREDGSRGAEVLP